MPTIRALPVLCAPIDIQREIARIAGDFDDKIELNRRTSETLESIARAVFKSWFVDFDPVRAKAEGRTPTGMDPETAALFPKELVNSELGPIPRNWSVNACGSVIELAYGKALPKPLRRPGRIPVFGSGGRDGTHAEHLVPGPGIVVGRKGTVGSVYWVDSDFYPIDTTFYVRPLSSGLGLRWIFERLRSMDLTHLSADSAVPGINRHAIYAVLWVLPPKDVALAFERAVAQVYDLDDARRAESETLSGTRDALLPRLLSGELRVPSIEPNERTG